MTYEELMQELALLKSHYEGGFSIIERTRIVEMYRQYLGKSITNLSCGDCYRDAFIEIYNYLKKQNKIPMNNYKLKEGHYLHKFGSSDYHFNPISDETAEKYLAENPKAIEEFEKFPEDWKERIKKGKKSEKKDETKPAKVGKGGKKSEKKSEKKDETPDVDENANAEGADNTEDGNENDGGDDAANGNENE